MKLPYNLNDEVLAIHREKLLADDVSPSSEERNVVAEQRAMQFALLLGRKLGQAGIGSQDIGKIVEIISGSIPDDGTALNAEEVIADAMHQARAELREFLGLDQPKKASP
jgi:hypothetical protein